MSELTLLIVDRSPKALRPNMAILEFESTPFVRYLRTPTCKQDAPPAFATLTEFAERKPSWASMIHQRIVQNLRHHFLEEKL